MGYAFWSKIYRGLGTYSNLVGPLPACKQIRAYVQNWGVTARRDVAKFGGPVQRVRSWPNFWDDQEFMKQIGLGK